MVTKWTQNMTSWPLFQINFHLRRPNIAIFADIIKTVTIFIKKILKESGKIKIIRNCISK